LILTIGKPAEFGPDNLPVRGQCQPHTRGWRLRTFQRGREELLHEDTYYMCTQLQRACIGIAKTEIRDRVRKLATELAQNLNVQETQRMRPASPEGETVVSLGDDAEGDASSTAFISRSEMEQEARKRLKKFDE
jgi:hypothetical protein